MVISVDIVLNIYKQLLQGTLSYSDADRWAWDKIQKFDNRNLEFTPIEDEALIWDLILFLYGIDIPDLHNKSNSARTKIEVIDFLKKKEVYDKI